MAAKRTKAPANDDLGDLFEGIGDKKPTKAKSSSAKNRSEKPEQDILAELEKDLGEQPSRPQTPRVKDAAKASKRTSTATPPPGRLSEDKQNLARKSGESARSLHASMTPSATSSDIQESEKKGPVEQTESVPANVAPGGGGGWWGGIFATASATASAAVKQAGQAYKEIQENEEAKKWTDQVRGNVGILRGLGDELRHRAMPTFADILQTLAPPISSHERLMIHITHDMVGYPALDPMIYEVFNRVMSQVEGGDLLVIQRGQESTARRPSDATFFRGPVSTAGWRDGPWWRQNDAPRDIGAVKGLVEGTKLCRVNAESYAKEYFAPRGGIEEAQKRAIEPVSEENPVRTSDIFFAIQAIRNEADPALFAGNAADEDDEDEEDEEEEDSDVADAPGEGTVSFALYLLDPVHEIMYSTMSQEMPAKWIRWLDASNPLTPATDETDEVSNELANIPEEIREIVESGGVDPREWVAEWVEEGLMLAVGVLAQRYVARRMGVGEGGLGKGKQKIESLIQDGGGEAARAGLL